MLQSELSKNRPVKMFSFPQYETSVYGKQVGRYLNGKFGQNVHPSLRSLLYAMDRVAAREDLITAARLGYVLCDRYVASNIAYAQFGCPDGELDEVQRLIFYTEHVLLGLPTPDLIFVLDMPVEFAIQNIAEKEKRSYTDKPADLHEKAEVLETVRQSYVTQLSAIYGEDHVQIIDCVESGRMLSLSQVFEKTITKIEEREECLRQIVG